MHSKPVLGREEVARVLGAAREEAQRQGWAVSIAVVDDGGHPLALERLDGCAPIGAYIATEKARSAALGRRETKRYEDMINGGRSAFLSVPLLQATLEGGVPILVDGQVRRGRGFRRTRRRGRPGGADRSRGVVRRPVGTTHLWLARSAPPCLSGRLADRVALL